MSRDKVVITGIGAVAPNGNNVNEFWTSLTNGISGIGPITYFDSSNHRVKIAGELNGFQPDSIVDSKEIRKLDPFSIYALVATQEAISMSGLDSESLNPDRIGVTIGTGVVKGFAVTLVIGILSSMFTAIVGTRAVISFVYENKNNKELSI